MAELRAELRELRKKSPAHISVSKMRLADVALEVGKLRAHLESSPSIGHDGGKSKKAMKGTTESVKEAKKAEFPTAPNGDMEAPKASKKKAEKVAPVPEAPKAEVAVKKAKPAKGSDDMKAHMAAIRGKKAAKKE
jgi:hypothetical protein